ncbi:MAG TPA: thrombospondin type 3 repeat-containing protein, partial [Ferruginibacter sp.]|nr:thrombospondin type 3 repeat-containing protein [Ferruginibacter sp.]
MNKRLTIRFLLSLTMIGSSLPVTAQVTPNYKYYPPKLVMDKDSVVHCGYYDELNQILYNCEGEIIPRVYEWKVLSPGTCCRKKNDWDGDGIKKKDDQCPNVYGYERYHGCPIPDTDKDGVNDEQDKCPDVAGLLRYRGCPIPDTDKDGIDDEVDKCRNVFGYIRYQGCPIPDTDKDSVNDEEDKCIFEPGPPSNYGCPIIP